MQHAALGVVMLGYGLYISQVDGGRVGETQREILCRCGDWEIQTERISCEYHIYTADRKMCY